jgi:hypothetical protein
MRRLRSPGVTTGRPRSSARSPAATTGSGALWPESGMLHGRDAREMAGPVWSLVHGIASLAIGGDLRHVGIRDDPEALAGRSLAQLLGFAEADSEPASSS